jgi:hypothetical protein
MEREYVVGFFSQCKCIFTVQIHFSVSRRTVEEYLAYIPQVGYGRSRGLRLNNLPGISGLMDSVFYLTDIPAG